MYEIGCDSTGDPDGGYFEYYESENRNIVVSLTRIEPPLHPNGPEKIVKDFGTEPENFDELGLIEFVKSQPNRPPTDGVFGSMNLKKWVGMIGCIGPKVKKIQIISIVTN